MKQEDKDLLLKDLCARLSYGLKCSISRMDDLCFGWRTETLYGYCKGNGWEEFYFGNDIDIFIHDIKNIKPYLFPLSSMTEEQKQYISDRWGINEDFDFEIDPNWGEYFVDLCDAVDYINWLNENHFDFRGLIKKGIAIDATGLNIY